MDDRGIRSVLGVARSVLSDLDLEVVLERVLESARELTGARYAALGVLDESRTGLARFLTAGLDPQAREAIGVLPRGRGVLGELIRDPRPLRLREVGAHPRSYGFPGGHPPMTSFLGVPILVAGEPYGNLYLTDAQGAEEFSEDDEQAVMMLAEFAGVAIDHARRYTGAETQRHALQQTVAALDATIQIARAVGGETDVAQILELVAKRGRALVSARALVIEQLRENQLVVAAAAGEIPPGLANRTVDLQHSVASAALRTLRSQRLEEEPNRARFERHGLGRLGVTATAGLLVPLVYRGHAYGVLVAIDRLEDGPGFTADDQRLLEAFGASAATALATAESAAADRRRQRLAAAEHERGRWARELHDETLQGLAGLRLGLSAALRAAEPGDPLADAVRQAVSQIGDEIAGLRSLITDLRPAALDELGLEPAIVALAERASRNGLEVDCSIDLAHEQQRTPGRLLPELETAVYRVIQEALTNARKHGHAERAVVEVHEDATHVNVRIRDDGDGFDPQATTDGFGLLGMRERTQLADGSFAIDSTPGRETVVTATFPTRHADEVWKSTG